MSIFKLKRQLESEKVITKHIKPGDKIFIDMDRVMVDFDSGINKLSPSVKEQYDWGEPDNAPGIFGKMDPMPGCIDAIRKLATKYDLYVLSTAPWKNPSAWSDKIKWIHKYFGSEKGSILYKKLIITHHKDFELYEGAYLIDDRKKNGAEAWDKKNKLINFGNSQFPDWNAVVEFLM